MPHGGRGEGRGARDEGWGLGVEVEGVPSARANSDVGGIDSLPLGRAHTGSAHAPLLAQTVRYERRIFFWGGARNQEVGGRGLAGGWCSLCGGIWGGRGGYGLPGFVVAPRAAVWSLTWQPLPRDLWAPEVWGLQCTGAGAQRCGHTCPAVGALEEARGDVSAHGGGGFWSVVGARGQVQGAVPGVAGRGGLEGSECPQGHPEH